MVVAMVRVGEHWEPPQARPLLMTVHALSERLGVKLDRAYGLSYSLGRVYYGPSHTHVRVLASRVDELVELLESGTPLGPAAEVLHMNRDAAVTQPPPQTPANPARGRHRRGRHW